MAGGMRGEYTIAQKNTDVLNEWFQVEVEVEVKVEHYFSVRVGPMGGWFAGEMKNK